MVGDVLAGQPGAADRFLAVAAPTLWSAICVLESEAARKAAFARTLEAIASDGFQRLKSFDGKTRLAPFLALLARSLLIEEVRIEVSTAPGTAWRRFERLFAGDIKRRIIRRFPRADLAQRSDLYQEIALKFLEDDFHRLRSHDGRGSFEGYILVLVDRLLIDLLRRERPRQRLPAAVEKLPDLERAVFKAIAWSGIAVDPAPLLARLTPHFPGIDAPAIRQAIDRVRIEVDKARASATGRIEVSIDAAADSGHPLSLPDGGHTPEEQIIADEDDDARIALVAAIIAAAEGMDPNERAYVEILLSASEPRPPREIAKIMGRPIEDVRQIQQRVMRRLKKVLETQKSQIRPS